MRFTPTFTVLAAAVLAASPVWAQAPTLGELAKKEEARRKAIQAPAKVLTNDDVKKGTPVPPPSAAPAKDAETQASAEGKEKTGKPDAETKDETYWKNRITQAREDLRRDEMFAEALQTRINALSNEFTARDDPYQRARIAEDRVKALAELDRLKSDIDAHKKKIAEIEEDARRAGVPAGWLR